MAKKKPVKPVKKLAEPLRPTNRLEKHYTIRARPEEVYQALTDERMIVEWSGEPALMDISPGGEFSLWNNTVQGINRLVTHTRIEQDWKEEEWKYPSNVVITLAAQPDGSTQVVLIHEGIPSLNFKAIDAGWDEYYLGAIKDYLEGR